MAEKIEKDIHYKRCGPKSKRKWNQHRMDRMTGDSGFAFHCNTPFGIFSRRFIDVGVRGLSRHEWQQRSYDSPLRERDLLRQCSESSQTQSPRPWDSG